MTLRELNRTTLLRQLLLARVRLPARDAIERLAGLQAQWAPSPYLALWSRLDGFRRDALERAIMRNFVVKAALMRATLHLVSAREFPLFSAAVRDAALVARTRGTVRPEPELVERVRELARERPVTRRDLHRLLGRDGPVRTDNPDDLEIFRQVHWLAALAELEQVPECALWRPQRTTAFRILAAEECEPLEARAHVIRRYLGAFGPASRADLATWSRVPLRDLDPALGTLRLRRFRDEHGRELLDLPRAPLAPADTPAPVRLLPLWDQILLAYDRRERILPTEYRPRVIQRNGDVKQTFLVDGFVAGLWTLRDGRVVLEPFDPLPRRARRELEEEARRLEAFVR